MFIVQLRFGATGKERVNALNYLFKQVVEIFIPLHMKYILWIASEGKHMFDVSANQDMLLQNYFSQQSMDQPPGRFGSFHAVSLSTTFLLVGPMTLGQELWKMSTCYLINGITS